MYTVLIDELVFEEDFRKIDKPDQQKIIKTIRKKLTRDPEGFGAPLRGDLKGLWKLRVGQYRVVYQIKKKEILVYVVKVGFGRNEELYREVLKRYR
ncbi:MAG: type II toxin-antitoxin system RelE/ParE family toxin [Thermodesulfobacteriota bacterium]|nr:type II toxin-antitoxin system RelE/ParE family toxin [Thermodesulfobacteriota bacterium]